MFPGYDPNRKPPYSYEVYFKRDGNIYKTIYYVCRGYGDSVSISSGVSTIVKEGEIDEKSNDRQSRQ
tara:strand:+ start:738 stop:938 length:201 start_codon:yes stop_codon:yes gene_type:complete